VRMAVTTSVPAPTSEASIEWDGLYQWRSFIDSRRGLDAEGKITSSVRPPCERFVTFHGVNQWDSVAYFVGPDLLRLSITSCVQVAPPWDSKMAGMQLPDTLAEQAATALLTADPLEKAAVTHCAFKAFLAGGVPVGATDAPERKLHSCLPAISLSIVLVHYYT
jgi:hypothetical protein